MKLRLRAAWNRLRYRTLAFPEPDFGTSPTCCPDAYWCPMYGEVECDRHCGFDVCCARPDAHISQDVEEWHRRMEEYERDLLDGHIRAWLYARRMFPPVTGPSSNLFSKISVS